MLHRFRERERESEREKLRNRDLVSMAAQDKSDGREKETEAVQSSGLENKAV